MISAKVTTLIAYPYGHCMIFLAINSLHSWESFP